MSEAGALRAARLGCHLLPQGPRAEVLEPWRRALVASGRDPDAFRVGIIRACLVTDDPERDWPPVRAAERYRGQLYTRFFAEAGRHVSFAREGPRIQHHSFGTDPASDRVVFGEGLGPEMIAVPSLSDDGRWLLITVNRGSTGEHTELWLQELGVGRPARRRLDLARPG